MRHAVLLLLGLCTSLSADDAERQPREEIIQESRLRAEATNVFQIADGKRVEAKLLSEPLVRYSDEPRDILDATLWAHGTPGRPVAFQKIELYRKPVGTKWFYCMTSLSESLIEAAWRDGQSWASTEPGTKFRSLEDGPKPAETKIARLFQMKQIFRRFDAVLVDPLAQKRSVMRPLARPLHTYADPQQGIHEGAIFGFTTDGTNPDALLSIELQTGPRDALVWSFGLARMTTGQVTVNLDGNQVWRVSFVNAVPPGRPAKYDSWLFFYEADVSEPPR